MKKRSKKVNIFRMIILISAISAICWDLAVTYKAAQDPTTFRYESDFAVFTGATVKVAIVPSDYADLSSPVDRDVKPSANQIEEMVAKAIELQGGFEGVVKKGNKVMIKVNLVGANSPSGQGENTDVNVVKALIKQLNSFTEGDIEIVVAEGTARTNDDPTSNSSVWANSGYKALLTDNDLAGINLRLLNLNQSIDDIIEVDLGDKGMSSIQGSVYGVHKEELEADVYIVVPVLKIHDTGITNALKLQVGSAPGCYYGYNKMAGTKYSNGLYHNVGHRIWTTEMIVDLCQIADIDFVVVDAIMCLHTKKTYAGSNQQRMNTIIAGVDPVAVDHVCARLMCLNPDDVAHITLAEKAGLGTNDPYKINVVGTSIDDAKMLTKKNQAENGKFGQSNRSWLLSQSFSGTDINKEYIENEATIKPKAGVDGWSQPIYFFDDRIDLLSYYGGATNVVTYAFSYFDAPTAQQAELWLGNHEAIKVYVNGEEVYKSTTTNSYGDGDLGKKKATINLLEGENTLLVKTLNKFGDFTFALNICEVESNTLYAGNRVDGLKFKTTSLSTGVEETNSTPQLAVSCYPNPATDILFLDINSSNTELVTVSIYDMKGNSVKQLLNEKIGVGERRISWNLQDNSGRKIAPGNYICTIINGEKRISKAIVVK